MSCKITLIGAGSVVFAKKLIGDILQFPELSDVTICLMDIDPRRLKVAEVVAKKMVAALKVKARITATMNRRAAIKGARYVICTVQVGGYKPGTVIDFEIPRKYGLLQTIGDTLGVGGVFRGLRTIPLMIDIARDIAEVGAPGCLFLNYSNPMAMNCMAVDRAVGIPHVGLCHSVQGTSRQLATYCGLPYADITYLVAGINHMAFFLKYEYRGQDAYPILFSLLDKPGFSADRVRFEMMRRTGYFVTESSEHQSEYLPYFIHHGEEVIKKFGIPIDEYLRRCESIIETWQETERQLLSKDGTIHIAPQSNEYGSFIIHSRETNIPRVIYGNVPNAGLINNLPGGSRRACVELPCLVDAQGIQPTRVGPLPPQLAALCQTNINVQDLTVEAALTLQREAIYHAVMLDPHTASVLTLDQIWATCDELIAAHQKHGLLGAFAPTVPGTGRAYRGTGDRVTAEVKVDELALNRHLETAKDKPVEIVAEITVTNPRRAAVSLDLVIDGLVAGEARHRPHLLKLKIPASQTIRKKVALGRSYRSDQRFEVKLRSLTPDVFTFDYVIEPRRRLIANGSPGVPVSLLLNGFPAVEGHIRAARDTLFLRLAVEDSKIVTRLNPWEGSSIELFFAKLNGTGIGQFFVAPQPGGRTVRFLNRHLKAVAGVHARISPRGAGYDVALEIPLAKVGIQAAESSFLFDVIVNLTALGDAHSGGHASLSGGFDSYANSSRFVRVDLAGAGAA